MGPGHVTPMGIRVGRRDDGVDGDDPLETILKAGTRIDGRVPPHGMSHTDDVCEIKPAHKSFEIFAEDVPHGYRLSTAAAVTTLIDGNEMKFSELARNLIPQTSVKPCGMGHENGRALVSFGGPPLHVGHFDIAYFDRPLLGLFRHFKPLLLLRSSNSQMSFQVTVSDATLQNVIADILSASGHPQSFTVRLRVLAATPCPCRMNPKNNWDGTSREKPMSVREAVGTAAPSKEGFSEGYKWFALGLLLLVYIFNFIDRQILAILQEGIKEDLGLSDTQLGLIGGIAFAMFYATLGIPIARLADKTRRTWIIAVSLAVWSAMTALCGAAVNFATLALARIGVAVGEAGCSPPAHSLISDYFKPEQRATALGIYALGIPIGVMIGYLAGGWINEFFGWRNAFLAVGLPGVALAVVVFLFLREPPRGMAEQRTGAEEKEAPPIPEVFASLWCSKSFRHLSLAAALHAFLGYGLGQWLPSFFIRIHGMSTGELSIYLGLMAGLAGGLGTFLGGYLSDRYGKNDKRWYMWIPAIGMLAPAPLIAFAFLVNNPYVAFALYVLPAIMGSFYLGPTFSMTQGLVDIRMRAVAASILLFILNLIGLGMGPLFVGMLSDLLEPSFGIQSLRYALLIVILANVWSAIHYFIAARTIREDLDRVAKETGSDAPPVSEDIPRPAEHLASESAAAGGESKPEAPQIDGEAQAPIKSPSEMDKKE